MPLPEGPRVAVSVDLFGSHSVTPRNTTFILLFSDSLGRRGDMFSVSPRYIPLDNGLQFRSKLSQAVYQLLGVRILTVERTLSG